MIVDELYKLSQDEIYQVALMIKIMEKLNSKKAGREHE